MHADAVTSRVDLEEYLGQSLLVDYHDATNGVVRQVATSLKTYIIETHPRRDVSSLFEDVFPRVEEVSKAKLLRVFDAKGNAYFIDRHTDRYPIIHTIARTNETDPVIQRLTGHALADRCWIPSKMLLGAQLGRIIGFRFNHRLGVEGLATSDVAKRLANDLGQALPPPFRLEVSEYANAEEDLQFLRSSLMKGRAALESLSWRSGANGDDSDEFIHDHVWVTGKVAAYGTSFATHLGNVMLLRNTYASAVDQIERAQGLAWKEGRLHGAPMAIELADGAVIDVGALSRDLVRAREPFRLLGVAQPLGAHGYRVNALDLHTNDRVDLEVTQDQIGIYLPTGSCGNVVMRLLTNLERYVSSEVQTSFDQYLAS